MRIGIIVPMKPEFLALGHHRVRPGAIEHLSSGVLAALSGVGPERARNTARRLIDEGATALMSWGCAAALRPDVRVGALLLPAEVIDANGTSHTVNTEWHQQLLSRTEWLNPHTGALVESTSLLCDAASKAALAQASGAVAADMESAAVAAFAHAARVPFVAVRAVSDAAGVGVPQLLASSVTAEGEIARLRAALAIAAAPSHWITAFKLALGFRAAQMTLRRVADRASLRSSVDIRSMFVAAKP